MLLGGCYLLDWFGYPKVVCSKSPMISFRSCVLLCPSLGAKDGGSDRAEFCAERTKYPSHALRSGLRHPSHGTERPSRQRYQMLRAGRFASSRRTSVRVRIPNDFGYRMDSGAREKRMGRTAWTSARAVRLHPSTGRTGDTERTRVCGRAESPVLPVDG